MTIIILLSSCVTQKNVEYLKDNNNELHAFREADTNKYLLQPKDELYIQISSLDDASAKIFSNTGNQQFVNIGSINPYGASLLSYTVDEAGNILLPVVGILPVKDKTPDEVGEMIKKSLAKILSQPTVTVKLVNRFITVLGEVQRPGHYNYYQEKISIYDALGLAGDATSFANRKKVILVRNEGGENHKVPVNLNDTEMLSSNYLYLRPNDIVYVPPMRKKFWAMEQFPYDLLMSAITAAILFYSVVK